MRTATFIGLVFLLAVLVQSSATSVNLVVLLMPIWLAVTPEVRWPWVALVAGVIFDLVTGGPLGRSVLFFLGLIFVFWLYSRKWNVGHPIFLTLLVLSGDWLSRVVWGYPVIVWQIALVGAITFLWGWWFWGRRSGSIVLG